jgi:hypothetical protein
MMTRDTNIVTFPGASPKRGRTVPVSSEPQEEVHWQQPVRNCNGPNMHTFLFRSSRLIVESDEADLVRDVRTAGRTNTASGGGIYMALELAEQAYQVHRLPYEQGLSKMSFYDPRRFTWVYDEGGKVDDCVKVRDNRTGRLAVWPHWHG